MSYERIESPDAGSRITVAGDGTLDVPADPIIPIIHGDGIGGDVGPAAQRVLGEAATVTDREVHWMRVYAGEAAQERYGEDVHLPDETVRAIRDHRVAIKGPLTTPVGAGFRSLNVALRQTLDLFANVRPTYHVEGAPSPVKRPERLDLVTFRENTEDVYAGIEWEEGTAEVERVRRFVEDDMGVTDVMNEGPIGIGLKPISERGTKRLVREAIDFALENDREKVTLVHKGNIMKFTEGQFAEWGMEVAADEYPDDEVFAAPNSLWENEEDIEIPDGAIMVDERIADAMLQWLLLRPDDFDVLAMPNLNGDYLSDAAGAQMGSLGLPPGANFGDGLCLAEPVHGSAPKRAGQDMANPSAMLLSGALMFEYMGWDDTAQLVKDAVQATISTGTVTYDLHRNLADAKKVGTSAFADTVIGNLQRLAEPDRTR